MPSSSCRVRCRGFTLIEVLAALIIVSLGMLGVIQAVSQTASNSVYLRDKTLAHWIAMNRLTEVRLAPRPPEIDESSDEVDYAGRRWRWTMEVSETPVESLRRIDVRVSLADAQGVGNLAVLTGFYGAALAPAGSTLVSWDPVEPGQQDQDAEEQQRTQRDRSAAGTQDESQTETQTPSGGAQ